MLSMAYDGAVRRVPLTPEYRASKSRVLAGAGAVRLAVFLATDPAGALKAYRRVCMAPGPS